MSTSTSSSARAPLEDAHRTLTAFQDLIGKKLAGADVLIHLEPEDRVRPGRGAARGSAPARKAPMAAGATCGWRRRATAESVSPPDGGYLRLIAADAATARVTDA